MCPETQSVCMLVTNEVTYDHRVLKEAGLLSRSGFGVRILALDRNGRSSSFEEREGFQILRCREWRWGRWLRHRRVLFVQILGKVLKVLRFFVFSLKARASIIHAHDLDTLPFGFLAARRCRAKLVYDSHEIYTEQWPPDGSLGPPIFLLSLLRHLESFLIRRVDAAITVGSLIAQKLASQYRIPTPLVLRNCAPLVRASDPSFSLRKVLPIASQERIVLHTGALVGLGRALRELVLAFQGLRPGIHLVFLGEGPLEAELREMVRREGLDGSVHFLKPVPPEALVGTMQGADLSAVVMKGDGSLNNLYSLPNKLFEAIAAGLPVVTSDLPEIANIVQSYEIGLLCQPEDPKDITRAIEEALSPDRYATFKANLKRAQEELNWEKESQKLAGLYRRLLGDRG